MFDEVLLGFVDFFFIVFYKCVRFSCCLAAFSFVIQQCLVYIPYSNNRRIPEINGILFKLTFDEVLHVLYCTSYW